MSKITKEELNQAIHDYPKDRLSVAVETEEIPSYYSNPGYTKVNITISIWDTKTEIETIIRS